MYWRMAYPPTMCHPYNPKANVEADLRVRLFK